MKIRDLKQSLQLKINKFLGRSFTPHPRENIFIDPTGLCNLACRLLCLSEANARS